MISITNAEDLDFEDCYDSITEKNEANFKASGKMASMEIAFLTYLCEKFSNNVNIMLSIEDKRKTMDILKKMGIKNEYER